MTMWDEDRLDSGECDCGCRRILLTPVSTGEMLSARKQPESRRERSAARCESVRERMERARIVMVPMAVITVLAALTMVAVG